MYKSARQPNLSVLSSPSRKELKVALVLRLRRVGVTPVCTVSDVSWLVTGFAPVHVHAARRRQTPEVNYI